MDERMRGHFARGVLKRISVLGNLKPSDKKLSSENSILIYFMLYIYSTPNDCAM